MSERHYREPATEISVTGITHCACAAILARPTRTFIDLNVADSPRKAGFAGACVAPLTRVGTCGPIHARLVVGTVVEIWNTQLKC